MNARRLHPNAAFLGAVGAILRAATSSCFPNSGPKLLQSAATYIVRQLGGVSLHAMETTVDELAGLLNAASRFGCCRRISTSCGSPLRGVVRIPSIAA